MLVLGVNSKRQRRPNVRLGEIGDVSAAISCASSWKFRENREEKNLKHERKNSKEMDFHVDNSGFPLRTSNFTDSDPGVSPRLDIYSRENRNPNSAETVLQFAGLETDVANAKLDFGKVTKKSRAMKRRERSGRDNSSIGSAWNSRLSSGITNENGKGDGDDAFGEPASNALYDVYTIEEFKDSLDRDTSDMSKHTYENEFDDPISDMNVRGDSDDFWTGNGCKERNGFSSDDGHFVDNKIDEVQRTGNGGAVVHDVREWLEGMGFEKYAGMFELHEVDEEVLPLLTFEDLKEMGVTAVGPRRKLFTAIQRLKDGPAQ
ncbi:Sterile alpha motif domain-containing protein [Cinnamomum micranthum f. kanehirae]|uniref:Sterile alpha motif domain-containing protein n=1 Tax=Cinnamomum micranthum f. kanehirae TaxID=337451 RepID=A0A3S3MYN7_9MAGN|nr:Sterile alpha motif domain-containing protein [Cinnamomum micranthum f. kanehirae]